MVLRIAPSDAEVAAGVFDNETLSKASACMRSDGALILERIVDAPLVREAREMFLRRYGHYLDSRDHHDALEVGDKRLMITIDLEPPFDRRELIANPWLVSVLSASFEDDFVLGAYGVVCSSPPTPWQHIHQDGGDLFPQEALNRILPIFAVTVAIPLIEMNETHGTTALWLGSHRGKTVDAADVPLVKEGSCVIWDYRLRHGGTPNLSTVPRPLLYMTYCRSWFWDNKNYRKQKPLRAPKHFFKELPEHLRGLLMRVQEM